MREESVQKSGEKKLQLQLMGPEGSRLIGGSILIAALVDVAVDEVKVL